MNGFLDRLAARAVGEAPLVHPRVPARFEPDAGALPAGPVEETVQVAEAVPEPRRPLEAREPVEEAMRTFEPEPRSVPAERRTVPVAVVEPRADNLASEASPEPLEILPTVETPRGASPAAAMTVRGERWPIERDEISAVRSEDAGATAHPMGDLRRDRRFGDAPRGVSTVEEASYRSTASSPPLPGEGSADGRGGRGVRVHRAAPPEELSAEPRRDEERPPAEPPPLRPRSALAADLPTVEPGRGAPLPQSLEEGEPSETVVHVSIGRIDVRATQPAAPERRPSRPGPRLSLGDYLKRREEKRR